MPVLCGRLSTDSSLRSPLTPMRCGVVACKTCALSDEMDNTSGAAHFTVSVFTAASLYLLGFTPFFRRPCTPDSSLLLCFISSEGFDHLWLSDIEIINGRQNIAPRLDAAVKEVERLLVVVIATREVMSFTRQGDLNSGVRGSSDGSSGMNESIDGESDTDSIDGRVISDLSKIDMIQEIWSKYKSKGAPVSDAEEGKGSSDAPKSGSIPKAMLSLTKKEAQRQLSDEDYKLWSIKNKKSKKNLEDSEDRYD